LAGLAEKRDLVRRTTGGGGRLDAPRNFGVRSTAPYREHYPRRKACRRMSVDFMNNLAGIAAMAAKKMMGRR